MDETTRIRRALTFDEIADLYDRDRPSIPPEILSDLFSATGLDPAVTKIFEIGCGTGQATLPLARLGCRITALEMGVNLASIASRKLSGFPNVAVVNTRLEDWQPHGESFDLVFAANAWHWLDPQTRYARAAALLRSGGWLAFTKAIHVFPEDCDPFFPAIQSGYEAIGSARMPWPPPPMDQIADSREEIEHSGFFCDVQVVRRLRIEQFSADEYIALMSTASDHRLMEPSQREYLFAEMRRLIDARPGGSILKHNLILLYLARRKP